MPSQNTPNRLADVLAGRADQTLFHSDDGSRTACSAVLALGETAVFRETSRRLVFCLCDNVPSGLVGYFALLQADAVPAMLSTGLASEKLRFLLSAYRPDFVWLPDTRVADIEGGRVLYTKDGYTLLAMQSPAQEPLHPSLALLLSTSGSTGTPKFVRLSHANLLENARSIEAYLALTPDERPITTLPPTYSYGLSILHSHLLAGSTIALTTKTFFDRGFWDFLSAAGVTSLGGVPYHYEMLKKLRFSRMDLPSLRTLTQAGGRMEPELTREFALHCQDKGMRFFSMYGQTEATARMSYLSPEKAVEKAGSIGRAVPGGRFWLEDEHGHRLDETEATGELVYEGRNVSMGYAETHADLARSDDNGGILRTGDLAARDADGDYRIVGRLKRFLKLFGNRVNLQDVEDDLRTSGHDAVCGGEDDRLDVYLADGCSEAARQIRTRLVADLKLSPKAIRIFAIEAVPRNDAGKIQYARLADLQRTVL